MNWRECTNCHQKMAPYEPRKRRGEHLLCKGCAQKPFSQVKTAAEGTPGADLSSDFQPVENPLLAQHRTPVGTNALGHPINHLGLPTSAPEDPATQMWPDDNEMGPTGHPLSALLPNEAWIKYAQKRAALGHPSPHAFKKTQGFHKAAHKDDNSSSMFGSHSHHPHVMPLGNGPLTLGPTATHLTDKHFGADGVTPEALVEASGDHAKMSALHLAAHEMGEGEHGHPAGKGGHVHQHLHSGSQVFDDPNLADWEKELLGHSIGLEDDEDGTTDAPVQQFPWPHKIKDHLKSGHSVDEQAISGSDLFNHDYHDDLHTHGSDHSHAPKPEALPYMAPLPEDSTAVHKAHMVIGHGHNHHDMSYLSPEGLKQAHEDAHEQGPADHQHYDDAMPAKYEQGDNAQAQQHLSDDHDLAMLDHGWQHNVEKHAWIHKTQHGPNTQPHHHKSTNPVEITPPPHDAPGGVTYQAMVDHLKSGNKHAGNFYDGWEHGESYESLENAHKNWHNYPNESHDHEHEDLTDPLGKGSVEELQKAEQGGPKQHPHHEDMTPEQYAEHMKGPGHEWHENSSFLDQEDNEQHETDHEANDADKDHTHAEKGVAPVVVQPKVKKPNTTPQWGDPGAPSDPEFYAHPHPQVSHPKNKSEVVEHLMDHHPEVDSADYENSEFKHEGFLKGWHAHLHSGKEHEISPADRHQHSDDDSTPKFTPTLNTFSHLATHHGHSEDEVKAMRHVDALAAHEHLHQAGDDEEIGHEHEHPGAEPTPPNPWFVNPEYAGENHEHLIYHGTAHSYKCPTCGSSPGNRKDDCPDCGHAMKPANATENQRERGTFGNHGSTIYDCHVAPHFTTVYGQAKQFGHRVIAAKLKARKAKYYDNLNHMAHDAYDRLHAMGEINDGGEHLGKHYQDTANNGYGRCCSDNLLSYAKGHKRSDGKYGLRRFRDSLRADGYDHIVVRNHADSPRGALNVFPLSHKQIHIVDENHNPPSGDRRNNDSSRFRSPDGWSQDTMPNEKEKLRPPAYLVDKDPRIGETKHTDNMTPEEFRTHIKSKHPTATNSGQNEAGLTEHEKAHASGTVSDHHHGQPFPKTAPEHPDDMGDPNQGEVGSGGMSYHSGDDDDDNESEYCSNCDTDGHGTYDDHCSDCEQYTGHGDCDCTYCPGCGHSTSHGDDPVGSGAHEYCSYCDEQGVQDGITDHDAKGHEDEHGEHPEDHQEKDYCPHCDSHMKENRDEDHCQNCGADLPDYDKIQSPASGLVTTRPPVAARSSGTTPHTPGAT